MGARVPRMAKLGSTAAVVDYSSHAAAQVTVRPTSEGARCEQRNPAIWVVVFHMQ
jgi:hypothetical protein